jgi:hypothetical protein
LTICLGSIGGRRRHQIVALCPRSALILIDDGLIGDMKDLVSFISHGVRSGSGTVYNKWKSKRLEGKSEK